MTQFVSPRELKVLMADHAKAVAEHLFPGGHVEGNDYVCLSRDRGGPGDSLKIQVKGHDRGSWCHFGEDLSGDMIDLVAVYVTREDPHKAPEARRWCRRWLGLEAGGRGSAEIQRVSAEELARRQAEAEKADAEKVLRNRRRAKAIWLNARPQLEGTPADWYLRGRALDIRKLAAPPAALRYAPALEYPWAMFKPADVAGFAQRPEKFPALVAAIVSLEGEHLATHRTYVESDREGAARKARCPDAKLTLGRYAGGLIRLTNGALMDKETGELRPAPPLMQVPGFDKRGRYAPIAPETNPLEWIALGEGLENTFTVACQCAEIRTAATVALRNMVRVNLPEFIKGVYLIDDNYSANPKAAPVFENAGRRFKALGKRVRIIRAPASSNDPDPPDLNDYWQRVAGAAA